jgi:DNA-binding beta-propeller fold protein YncE
MRIERFLSAIFLTAVLASPACASLKKHTPTPTATATSTATATITETPNAVIGKKLYTFDALWDSKTGNNEQLNDPEDIDIDPAGRMIISDSGNNRLVVWDLEGKPLLSIGSFGSRADWRNPPQFNHPTGVFVHPGSRKIYVADTQNHRIVALDEKGMVLSSWGGQGTGNGQFNLPRAIAQDHFGNLWVLDSGNSRVQTFSALGQFISTWGTFGTTAFLLNNPLGMAINNIDQAFIADTGNYRFEVFNTGGVGVTQQGWNGDGPYQFKEPGGILVTKDGWVAVVDGINGGINFYNSRNGGFEFVGQWRAKDNILTPGYAPHYRGIACDSLNRLYLTDIQNNAILRLKPVKEAVAIELAPTPTVQQTNPYGGAGYPIR